MRKFFILPLLGFLFIFSCKKKGETTPAPSTPGSSSGQITLPADAKPDTIADGAIIKITLQLDSAALDETLLEFNHSASGNYSNSMDAIYFPGFGNGSLSSITCDGMCCAIQAVPYRPGRAIALDLSAKKDGVYLLKTSFTKNIPADKAIWLKDAYRKDSLNIRIWNYRFDIFRSDTSSYGSTRFTLLVR